MSLSAIVGNTVGMLGVRGLSSTGSVARNFVRQSLTIGNQTSINWIFSNIEIDSSFMVFCFPSVSTGVVMTSYTQATTQVNFVFNPAVPSGILMNILLLR